MEPSLKRLEAILKMSQHQSADEEMSLLGMLMFSSKFIPNFSTLTEPLRIFTHKNTKFEWVEDQKHSYNKLIKHLGSPPVVSYFHGDRETEIITDASPVTLRVILIQYNENRAEKVIAYANHGLTPVEQRYAQIEREALTVVWACKRVSCIQQTDNSNDRPHAATFYVWQSQC